MLSRPPRISLLSLKSLSSGGFPLYCMCWKRLWPWESATDEKSGTAPPFYVARHFRFGGTRPKLSIFLHMRTLEISLLHKCSIYVLVWFSLSSIQIIFILAAIWCQMTHSLRFGPKSLVFSSSDHSFISANIDARKFSDTPFDLYWITSFRNTTCNTF